MEAKYCSDTSIDFQRTTRRYIPEFFITTTVKTLNPTEDPRHFEQPPVP
jgi:hypothetical protein